MQTVVARLTVFGRITGSAVAFIGKLPTGPSPPQSIPIYKPEGKGPWRVKQRGSNL